MYVLNLDKNHRVLSIWEEIEGIDYKEKPIVNILPEKLDSITNYRYINGEYMYDPVKDDQKSAIGL